VTGHVQRVPNNTCPYCGTKNNGAGHPTDDARVGPGDISICTACSGVSEYDVDLKLHAISRKRLKSLTRSDPRLAREVEHCIEIIRRKARLFPSSPS